MPREFRRITFSNSDLKDALSGCRKGFKDSIRLSDVVSTAPVRRDDRHLLELALFDFSKEKKSRLEIAEHIVRDCPLDYCQSQSIPLPRSAEKTLRLIKSNVCIDMNYDVPAD